MQKIGIIGGGRFGSYLAVSLAQQGVDVLFLDKDISVVQHMRDVVARAVQGDASDPQALAEAGFAGCDVAVVAMASNLEASILATMALKDLKVPRVIAKAASENAGKVLDRIGADQIVYPERDRAMRLARTLCAKSIIDYVQVSAGTGILKIEAPEKFVGKRLADTRIRNLHGITILEVRRHNTDGTTTSIAAPGGEEVLQENDTLIIFGSDEHLRRFEKELT